MKTSPPGRGRAITEMIMTGGGGRDEGRVKGNEWREVAVERRNSGTRWRNGARERQTG